MERKTETAMDFSSLIAEFFQKTDMTQEKFAEAMDVSVTTVQYWMAGKNQPAPDKWQKLISTLGIPVNLWYEAMNLEGEKVAPENTEEAPYKPEDPAKACEYVNNLLDEELDNPRDIPSVIYPEPIYRKDGSYYTGYFLPKRHALWYDSNKLDKDLQKRHYEIYVENLEKEILKKCTEVADRILKEGFDAKIASDDAWLDSYNKRVLSKPSKDKEDDRRCYVSSVSCSAITYAMRALVRSAGLYIMFSLPCDYHNDKAFKNTLLKVKVDRTFLSEDYKYYSGSILPATIYDDDSTMLYYKTYEDTCKLGAEVSRRRSSKEIKATIIMMLHDVLPAMDLGNMFDEIDNACLQSATACVQLEQERENNSNMGGIPVSQIRSRSVKEPIILGVSEIPPKCAPADTRNRPRKDSMTSKEFGSIAKHLAEEFE